MDESFRAIFFENIINWVERFKMVTLMKGINKPKLFIIGRLNLKAKPKNGSRSCMQHMLIGEP
jgi:hypothetical protein